MTVHQAPAAPATQRSFACTTGVGAAITDLVFASVAIYALGLPMAVDNVDSPPASVAAPLAAFGIGSGASAAYGFWATARCRRALQEHAIAARSLPPGAREQAVAAPLAPRASPGIPTSLGR